ncbi:MAG: hypothetical protein IAB19_06560 [Proteobacteria bacterium]|uniref:Uncharacterized protein n=1 Tax=Candidatus Avisuccinivibrio stercorigallinarum TaxID=2840704 RepID=A0A9D9DA80_9GAMM|nr:hypothetical protein [Candidatus Avisuccinivibrio stercorigallinarum]
MDKSYIEEIRERIQAKRKKDAERLAKRIRRKVEEEKQRALAELKEKKQRELAEELAELEKEKDLAIVGLLKNIIFTRYQDRFCHGIPEEVQKTIDNAKPEDIKALYAIFNYLSGHKGDEKEFMHFAKTSLAQAANTADSAGTARLQGSA